MHGNECKSIRTLILDNNKKKKKKSGISGITAKTDMITGGIIQFIKECKVINKQLFFFETFEILFVVTLLVSQV